MRISTAFQYSSASDNVSSAQQLLYQYQQELSSGKRITQPSDDPYGTTMSINATTINNSLKQFDSNINYAKSYLGVSETAINQANKLVTQAYSLAISGATASMSQDGRNAMVSQVTDIQHQLLSLANSQGNSGEYIFAGEKSNNPPFSVSGSTLAYAGDQTNVNVETGPGNLTVINIQGSPLFSDIYSHLENLKNNLLSGNIGGLSNNDIANLQADGKSLSNIQGQIGAVTQGINNMMANNQRRELDLTTQISAYTDADIAKVAVQYQSAQAGYQAALTVASQGFKMSLMDYIHA